MKRTSSHPASPFTRRSARRLPAQSAWSSAREQGQPSFPMFLVRAIATAAAQLGLPADVLLRELPPDAGALVGVAEEILLNALATWRSEANDDALGLRLAHALDEASLHLYAPILAVSPTMRALLETHVRIESIVPFVFPWQFWQQGAHVYCGRQQTSATHAGRVQADLMMSLMFEVALRFWGEWARPSLGVEFSFAAPAQLQPYVQSFGDKVRFARPITALSFPVPLLDRERTHADHALANAVTEAALNQVPLTSHWADRVTSALRTAELPAQRTAKELGQRWGLSERSLRRKLQTEHTTLARLFDLVLQDRARELLASPTSIKDVAEQLGYYDVSSFQRAFRRWFGVAPGEYRRRAALDA